MLPSKGEQFLQKCYKHDDFFPLRRVIIGFNGFHLVSGEHELNTNASCHSTATSEDSTPLRSKK